MNKTISLICSSVLLGNSIAFADVLTIFAGNGNMGHAGDNGSAINAELNSPNGVTVDANGNVYIADAGNNLIRKVDAKTKNIQTIAGRTDFGRGYSGDGGPALSAMFDSPNGTAIDRHGNVYISDTFNCLIRKVDAKTKIVKIIAGNNFKRIKCGYSGDGGPAVGAQIEVPHGVVVDKHDNVYIVDRFNNRIRKVDASGIITTFAGNGTFGYSGDNGPATSAKLAEPEGIALDTHDNLYIADSVNNIIRKVDAKGIITTVAGKYSVLGGGYSGDNGQALSAQLDWPHGVAVDANDNIYIADSANRVVRKVDELGIMTTIAGNGTTGIPKPGLATSSNLYFPDAVAVDAKGSVYVTDSENHLVVKIN